MHLWGTTVVSKKCVLKCVLLSKQDGDMADYIKGNKLLMAVPCGKEERRGDWDRTSDLLFPKQARYRCATPRDKLLFYRR